MINHLSLSVNNPFHVANVVAELWKGKVAPFPHHPDSYVALALDSVGTIIEFLPKNTVLEPGLDPKLDHKLDRKSVQFAECGYVPVYTATHANIAVPISEEDIYAIAHREGWRAVKCNRTDFFDLIEFWIENEVLLELMPPTLIEQYRITMHPENLKAMLNAPKPS
jgi:hypothetical protein